MDSFYIKNIKIPHRLILAPMCGITLKPFRIICKELGAGLVFNQMVSAKAITMGDKKSLGMLAFDTLERPIAMQLFGNNADTLALAASIIQDRQPDMIDLNLGCPAKKIVNDGGGSALLGDLNNLRLILSKIRSAITVPFTVKIRAGWDENSKNAMDVARMAEDEGVDAITIHARTRTQGYSGHADWDLIKTLKNNLKIPVIGNGDVITAQDALRMRQETGCDAVMTGRGAFHTPWIFNNYVNHTDLRPDHAELKELILRQYTYFTQYFGQTGGIKMMRKFICAYSKGMRNGSAFRNDIVTTDDWHLILQKIHDFFSSSD